MPKPGSIIAQADGLGLEPVNEVSLGPGRRRPSPAPRITTFTLP